MIKPKVVPPMFRATEDEKQIARDLVTHGEKLYALALAKLVLERPHGDPDDDISVLARQLLRALERLGEYREARHDP
jgi:hypothetical protein